MTIKVTYNVTDVYMSQSISPVYINVSYSDGGASGGGVWGSITGTLSNQTDLQTALDLKVPYSGATGNVNLGEYELKAGQVTLDTSPTGTAAVGTIRWNDTTGTSETTLKGGNVIIKNGVDLVARVVNKVSPNTTLTKAAYQAVRVSGAQGQRLAIELAQANNDAGSADTIGLVTETIAPNQEGFIMTVGQLDGINTTGSLQGETWVDGDVLYLSPTTAGAITNVKPTGATGHLVIIGYVEYAHANNGKLYIKVANGFELDELHNVSIVTPTNNQGLFYNSSNSLWENKTISTALGYTPVPTTRNITINGVTYDLSADRTYTISTGISGSGAAGQVTYWTGASAVSGSTGLLYNDSTGVMTLSKNQNAATFLTITNTTSGTASNANLTITSNNGSLQLAKYSPLTTTYKILLDNDSYIYNNVSGDIAILNDFATGRIKFAAGAVSTSQMTLFANGNLAINSGVSDLGVRFGVLGDTLLRGSGNTSATTALTVQNSSSTNLLVVQNHGGVGIGTTSLTNTNFYISKFITGGTTAYAFRSEGQIRPDVTASAFYISTSATLASAAGLNNIYHYSSTQGSFNSTAVNQFGYFVDASIIGATNNYGFYGNIASGTGRWNLYMNGTANNYVAGNFSVGTTSVTNWLNIAASTTAKAHINLVAGSTPTAPANGDIWFDGTDIKMRIGGVTKTFTLI